VEPVKKEDLEVKIRRQVQILEFFKGLENSLGWKYLKEDYLDNLHKMLRNSLEEENDGVKMYRMQGALRNMKSLSSLRVKIERTHGELLKILKRMELKEHA